MSLFNSQSNGQPPAGRAPAADVARIQGGGLTQVIVTNQAPITYQVFLNGRPVPPEELATVLISITAPDDLGGGGEVQATLTQRIKTITGEEGSQQINLFPGTVEIVAQGRRVCVSSTTAGQVEGIWINLGLQPDGSSSEVNGAKALRIVLNNDVLDARLTWNDGQSEELLPLHELA